MKQISTNMKQACPPSEPFCFHFRCDGGANLCLHYRAPIPKLALRRSLLVRERRLAIQLHPGTAGGNPSGQAVPHPLRQLRRVGVGAGVRHGPTRPRDQPTCALQVRRTAAYRFDQVERRLLPFRAVSCRIWLDSAVSNAKHHVIYCLWKPVCEGKGDANAILPSYFIILICKVKYDFSPHEHSLLGISQWHYRPNHRTAECSIC